jgi:hypothetical protein
MLKPFIIPGANIRLAIIIVLIERSSADLKEFQMLEYDRMMDMPPIISKQC